MSTVNLVKYYFYNGMMPKDPARLHQLVALAYQTARDRQLYPKEVLIRSEVHNTTSINGRRQTDPLGWHVTLCYKNEQQVSLQTHVASHGYVADKKNLDFVAATHAGEKPDTTPRGKEKGKRAKTVWPSQDELEAAPEIGYGHLPENN